MVTRTCKKLSVVLIALLILSNLWLMSRKRLPDSISLSRLRSGKESEPVKHATTTEEVEEAKIITSIEEAKPSSANKETKNEDFPREVDYSAGMHIIKGSLDTLVSINPGINNLDEYNLRTVDNMPDQSSNEIPATSKVLGLYLRVSDDAVSTLKESHARVIKQLPNGHDYKNYFKGRGIVMTGGGKYFPMVLTAIRWIRETDKTTPIEVFMSDETEYEEHICDGLFPKLNTECRVVSDIYGKELADKLKSKYALKPMAILASKFDDIYFMDADSYPIGDINRIFDWKTYKQQGLVLTADYWPRFVSPRFYEIANVTLGGRARGDKNSDILWQSDRENAVPGMSTESGQMFIRKSQHMRSLLLAMYYNIYGPKCYFPLLMQGGPGEGDKDTYAVAASLLGEPFYQTHHAPLTLGQHLPDHFKGYSMSPIDPIIESRIDETGKDLKKQYLALHANIIKSNIKYMVQDHEDRHGSPPLRKWRFFGEATTVKERFNIDEDLELKFFRSMEGSTCDWALKQNYSPRDWNHSDVQRFCRLLHKHTEWLAEHPDVAAPADAEFWIDIDEKEYKESHVGNGLAANNR